MNQDNVARLKEKFRFAEAGARCRTDGFINPSLASLGQHEWMEAECATGQGWDIKVMKLSPAIDPGAEAEIEQIYLEQHRNLGFGAMILKLVEYQKGQRALGFISDQADKAQLTGAPHFRAIAEKEGIAFNQEGNPIAPVNGLITVPGKYPVSAFKKAHQLAAAAATDMQIFAENAPDAGRALRVIPAFSGLSVEDATRLKIITGELKSVSESLSSSGTRYALEDTGFFYKPGYFVFEKKFRQSYATIDKLMAFNPAFTDRAEMTAVLKVHLNAFEFQAFRLSASWIMHHFSEGHENAKHKKSKSAFEDAVARCKNAWGIINPDIAMNSDTVLDFTKASDGFYCNTIELDKIVSAVGLLANASINADGNLPVRHLRNG